MTMQNIANVWLGIYRFSVERPLLLILHGKKKVIEIMFYPARTNENRRLVKSDAFFMVDG